MFDSVCIYMCVMYLVVVFLYIFVCIDSIMVLRMDLVVGFAWQKCINYWPEDGRAYVALGKILSKQSETAEARAVYDKGCQATQGENAFIWQVFSLPNVKNL